MSNRTYTPPQSITYPNMGEQFDSASYDSYYDSAISQHQVGISSLRVNGQVTGAYIWPVIGDFKMGSGTTPNTDSMTLTLPLVFPSGVDSFSLLMRYYMAKTGSQVQSMTVDIEKISNITFTAVTQNIFTSPATYNSIEDSYTTGTLNTNIQPISGNVERGKLIITVTKSPSTPAQTARPNRYWDGLLSLNLILFRS
ncbi:MAG: hypothetical protein GWN62_16855 [Aliifodinibius sp.]|nr:hypothetical protein [Fodinibius sp.]